MQAFAGAVCPNDLLQSLVQLFFASAARCAVPSFFVGLRDDELDVEEEEDLHPQQIRNQLVVNQVEGRSLLAQVILVSSAWLATVVNMTTGFALFAK